MIQFYSKIKFSITLAVRYVIAESITELGTPLYPNASNP